MFCIGIRIRQLDIKWSTDSVFLLQNLHIGFDLSFYNICRIVSSIFQLSISFWYICIVISNCAYRSWREFCSEVVFNWFSPWAFTSFFTFLLPQLFYFFVFISFAVKSNCLGNLLLSLVTEYFSCASRLCLLTVASNLLSCLFL